MYCTLADVHTYLNIPTATTGDDALITALVSAACQRIDDVTKRRFEALADSARYYDSSVDVCGRQLELNADLSHITSVVSDGQTIPATEYTVSPRNVTPWRELVMRSGSSYTWAAASDPEDSIVITGRWACMLRYPLASLARATNTVTAGVVCSIPAGAQISVVGSDAGFVGNFTLVTNTGSAVTWAQTGDNATATTAGYLLATPPSIRQAAIRLTAWLYRQKDNQSGDFDRPLFLEGGGVLMPQTLPADVQALLREWVLIL